MNIAFISPECTPFSRASGLGDLVSCLAKGIEQKGHNIKVFTPRYGSIEPLDFHIERIPSDLKVNHKGNYIQTMLLKGIIPGSLSSIFFIESQNHFGNSKETYREHALNEERFEYFASSVLEVILKLKLEIEIIHLFNPFSAPIVKMLRSKKAEYPSLKNCPLVFTIYDLRTLRGGSLIATKEAIKFSNLVTCTSNSYLKDLLSDVQNIGLSELLIQKRDCFCSIPNDIDKEVYNPETDKVIAQNFSKSYFTIGKRKCKEELLEACNFQKDHSIPLFGIIVDTYSESEIDLLVNSLPQITNLNIQLVILGKTKEPYWEEISKVISTYKNVKSYPSYEYNSIKKLYAGVDFFLSIGIYEVDDMNILNAMKYGSIPVAHNIGLVKDIFTANSASEETNVVVFKDYNEVSFIEAMNKAIKYYKNKEKWPKLVKQAMAFDSRELNTFEKYIACYEKLANIRENVLQ